VARWSCSFVEQMSAFAEARGVRSAPGKYAPLVALVAGYGLVLATVWTERSLQRQFFWITAAFFFAATVSAFWRQSLELPRLKTSLVLIVIGMLVAGSVMLLAAWMGTLHVLFGRRNVLAHAWGYLVWALLQQYLQQCFFFVRIERFVQSGLLASFIAAAMFAMVHLPNPVLTPVTFIGGWILSEIYRRYRTILPLGIVHGMVGLALAVSIPDGIMHHMRVGLGYLRYHG
jgi:CAAX prenyl protease-like protein